MRAPVRAALAALSGLLSWLAFPPVGAWPLAILGVAGLALAVHAQRARTGLWLGLLHGIAFFLPLLWWMSVIGYDALVLVVLLQALFSAALGAGLAATSTLRAWPVVAAGLWVGAELARSWIPFGGFPWGRLAYAQAGSPYESFAAYGGMALVSALVALSGTLLTWLVVGRRWRRLIGPGLAVAVVGVGLLLPTAAPAPAGEAAPVALVQGNVPGAGMDALGEARTVTRNHLAATEELAADIATGAVERPVAVIWPENSTDIDPLRDQRTRSVVERAVAAVDVPVLVGAILDGPGEDYRRTAGVVWDPVAGPQEPIYVKRHPVPFGEYIPFRQELLPLVGRLEQVGRDTFAGEDPGVLELGPFTIGDVICFEVAYDDLVRDVIAGGAEVLVVQTNNATYGGTAQPEQQWEISRLRAVETGRTVLVAATSGISGVIGPDGTVVEQTAEGVRAVVVSEVAPRTARTIASRLGAWPEWILTGVGVGGLVLAALGARAARSQPPPELPSRRTRRKDPVHA